LKKAVKFSRARQKRQIYMEVTSRTSPQQGITRALGNSAISGPSLLQENKVKIESWD
jgi:hypothetical protein